MSAQRLLRSNLESVPEGEDKEHGDDEQEASSSTSQTAASFAAEAWAYAARKVNVNPDLCLPLDPPLCATK
jgi:hypothetical protein